MGYVSPAIGAQILPMQPNVKSSLSKKLVLRPAEGRLLTLAETRSSDFTLGGLSLVKKPGVHTSDFIVPVTPGSDLSLELTLTCRGASPDHTWDR